jgi:hypothetical protein
LTLRCDRIMREVVTPVLSGMAEVAVPGFRMRV